MIQYYNRISGGGGGGNELRSGQRKAGRWIASHNINHAHTFCSADWSKLHDMFKARDATTWQHTFPVGFPVRVCALNLYGKQMGA